MTVYDDLRPPVALGGDRRRGSPVASLHPPPAGLALVWRELDLDVEELDVHRDPSEGEVVHNDVAPGRFEPSLVVGLGASDRAAVAVNEVGDHDSDSGAAVSVERDGGTADQSVLAVRVETVLVEERCVGVAHRCVDGRRVAVAYRHRFQ